MFALNPGMMPAMADVLRPVMLAAALALAGCASQTSSYQTVANAPATRVAGYASNAVEDDGLPAQPPPPSRIRDLPDDPSEPYSRNYGGPHRAASGTGSTQVSEYKTGPSIPDDLPPAFRSQLVAAIGTIE